MPADRELVDHIKRRLRKGHDVKIIRDQLLKTGFPYFDVHQAIDVAFTEYNKEEVKEELKQELEENKMAVRQILRPSKRKFILPLLVLFALLLHFFGNVSYLPDIGERLCKVSELNVNLENVVKQNSTEMFELQGQVLEEEAVLVEKFKTLLFFNFPFVASGFYKVDPLFQIPCEITGFSYSPRCTYYIAQEDYECIKQNEEKSEKKPITALFNGNIPEYRRIFGIDLIFNSLLLLAIYYLINCLIVYFYYRAKLKLGAKKKEALEIGIIIAIILLMIIAAIAYLYLLNLIKLKFG